MTTAPELYACLYAKEFPLQALLRLRPELSRKPCIVMDGEAPIQQVCSLNTAARKLGVAPAMTRVEVDTFPTVLQLSRSLAEEAVTGNALLECIGAFSPRVEDCNARSAFLCGIDIAGTEKLFGPPHILARTLLQRVHALGLSASIAVCANFHAAICIARGKMALHSPTVVAPGQEAQTLSPLPLSVLDLSETHAETFSLWGIHTLGMLADLPETALIARMGQDGKRLRQLARGELPHFFRPVEPGFALVECIELDTPVELLDSLLFVIGMMLEQLILRASARIFALASVTIILSLEGGILHTRTVRPALPTNQKQLWIKLIHLDLEANPPQAAILSVEISAEHGQTAKFQLGLFSPQLPEPLHLDVTLARIRSIVGEDRVGRAHLKDAHRFESFTVEPFALDSKPPSNALPTQARASARILRPPEIVTVTLRGEAPAAFRFRGSPFAVEHAYGPWIASGDWWNPTLWSNRQWDVIARPKAGNDTTLCCCLLQDLAERCWKLVSLYD